jgi:lipid-binding SYLF domain-containing protein
MKKILAFLCMAAFTATAFAASSKSDLNDRLEKARLVINQLSNTPDHGIPDAILEKAVCVAVVPSLVKGAFVIGGEYGQGVVTCRTGHGWSAPVFIRVAGGSYGFQIGGKSTDVVMVATNQQGMQALLKTKFKIGADASAAAGPVGRDAGAHTSINMSAELLTYSRSKGLFAGVDLNGATVNENQDDTDVFYGRHEGFASVLSGRVPVPAGARPFVRTVAKYFHSSQD